MGLVRSLVSQEDADRYFEPASPRPHLTQKQGAFLAWYREFFAGIRECPVSSCGPVELVEAGGLRVAVLPINSAFFSQDDHDHAKLWIGRRSLDEAVKDLGALDANLRIALIHHPLDWLADLERENVRGKLAENVDVLLRGHLHETGVQQVVSPQGELVHLAAGAANQTRRWANRALYVTLTGSSLTVFPIRYEDSPTEVWTVDPSVFPNDPQHTGLVRIPALGATPIPEPKPMPPMPPLRLPPLPPPTRQSHTFLALNEQKQRGKTLRDTGHYDMSQEYTALIRTAPTRGRLRTRCRHG